jgi:cell division protein FtsW
MVNPVRYLYRRLMHHQVQGYDLLLICITLLLVLTGVVMIYSASSGLSDRTFGSSGVLLRGHLVHLAVGMIALMVAMRLPLDAWKEWIPIALLVSFLLLILVLVPGIGHKVGGARRWFRVGPISIQPTELLKLVLIAFVASYLDRKQAIVSQFFRGVMPGLIVMGVFLLLVLLQPDFGTTVLMALTILLMIFVGGAKPAHIFLSLSGAVVLGGYLIASQSYRMKRFLVFLNPWSDPQDSGFQIIQSYLAIGNGGVFGLGLGDSRQKMFFLPDAHTDFIFSILAEELGLLGVLGIMFLFAVFVWRGYKASLAAGDEFSRYLGYGITTLFSLQIVLNLAVVMGMLPTKGLPLPFISLGGSSLVLSLFMTGILLNIGRRPTPWSGGDLRRSLR